MAYYAHFTRRHGQLFRFDTRIYLRDDGGPGIGDECVAAMVGKNPGSAAPRQCDQLAPLERGQDKLLPTVRGCFQRAYARAEVPVPARAFVRVLNLFYLCNPALEEAVRAHAALPRQMPCVTEAELPDIVWFVWGGAHAGLNPLKARFQNRPIAHPFFVDKSSLNITPRVPRPDDFAKHTQGLNTADVVGYLANLIAGERLLR